MSDTLVMNGRSQGIIPTVTIVYRDGTWKSVLASQAWEYENDPDYLATIPVTVTRWIDMSENPSKAGTYLCIYRDGERAVRVFDKVWWTDWDGFETTDIIAWMPIPPFTSKEKHERR